MKPNRHEQLDFISAVYLGTVAYATGLELQERLTEMRHAGQIGNVLLLLEHPRVITLGRRADRGNILASPELLEHRGIEVFESTRGGDVTYHGPGQLVGYPIFDLRSFHRAGEERKILRPVEYVRGIEEALMQTCGEWGVPAGRIRQLTGVWVATSSAQPSPTARIAEGSADLAPFPSATPGYAETQRQPRKIAAIGVHISHGITSHGFALNVNTNLDDFKLIVPCGLAKTPVTSMASELARDLPLRSVAQAAARNFGRVFDSETTWFPSLEDWLASIAAVNATLPGANHLVLKSAIV